MSVDPRAYLSVEAQEDEDRLDEERRRKREADTFDAGFAEYEESLRAASEQDDE